MKCGRDQHQRDKTNDKTDKMMTKVYRTSSQNQQGVKLNVVFTNFSYACVCSLERKHCEQCQQSRIIFPKFMHRILVFSISIVFLCCCFLFLNHLFYAHRLCLYILSSTAVVNRQKSTKIRRMQFGFSRK